MADPGFLPGCIGAVVSKLLDRVLDEVRKVVRCKKYCRDLKKMLEPWQPVLAKLASETASNVSEDVRHWLDSLKECQLQAQEQFHKCSSLPWYSICARRTLSQDIQRVEDALELRLKEAPMVDLRCLIGMDGRLIGIDDRLKRMDDQIAAVLGRQGSSSHGQGSMEAELQPVPKVSFGIEEASQRLEKVLVEGQDKWVGIWGPPGCGKTLLAQTANNSGVVRKHFEEGLFWLTVAREPNVQQLHSKLHKMVTNSSCTQVFDSREEGRTTLFNLLRNRKALLILDDVWVANVLEWFDVLTEESGSKILLTSRNKQVVGRGCEQQVSLLNEENSIKLFCVHAFPAMFPGKYSPESALQVLAEEHGEEFVCVVRDIVAECKHLPLALKVIGGALLGHEPREFRLALVELQKSQGFTQGQEEQEMYERLKLSYDDLGRVKKWGEVLQQCFLYFAAFPEDYRVDPSQLISYWVGEGLICYNSDGPDTETAWYLLNELSRRSLIEPAIENADGRPSYFKMHDVLRDLAFYIVGLSEDVCLLRPGKGLATYPEEWTHETRSLRASRLSLMDNELQVVPRVSMNAPALRVLLLNGNEQLLRIEDGFLSNFPNLRVLDLSWTSLERLPDDFGSLKNLVFLDLSYTELTALPSSIWEMVNLEHLDLSGSGSLDPDNLGQFCELVKLRYLHTPINCLSYPVTLTTLRMECLHVEALPLTLSKLLNLRLLGVWYCEVKTIPWVSTLQELRELELFGCRQLKEIPPLDTLQNLQSLRLDKCRRLKEFPPLDSLQSLQRLDLQRCDSLERLPHTFGRAGGFPKLQTLRIESCKSLGEFPMLEPGALPRLSTLRLYDCNLLGGLDNSLQVLGELRSLSLVCCTRLATLPNSEAFWCLQKLEELDLLGTGVTELPDSIARLPLLKNLDVSHCRMLEVLSWPDEQSKELFPSLEEANFSESSVQHIPLCMVSSRLRSIKVKDCERLVSDPELWRQLELNRVEIDVWPDWLSSSSMDCSSVGSDLDCLHWILFKICKASSCTSAGG